MGSSRISAPSVIILSSDALERRGLVDGHARAAMLILMISIRRIDGRAER